jgi:SAM-dependent methyltransferase
MSALNEIVESHYASPGLIVKVREALRQGGLDPDHLQQSDLDGADQFHAGGLPATIALAQLANIRTTDRVLDVGSGIGGPSRHLASTIGCHVTGLDLTEEFCQVATMLARSTGLSDLLIYERGDALSMPFDDASFDVVWTQHAAMNIADKAGLYREIFRVLRPGGRLALHDICAGNGAVRYPVPWAKQPESSFLISTEELHSALESAGFTNISSHDVTAESIDALKQVALRPPKPGFNLRTIMGPEFPAMLANMEANLKDGSCLVLRVFATTGRNGI